MVAPVEHTKWMTSTWDCTLTHGYVYWASPLAKWTSYSTHGVRVFTVELLWTIFEQLFPPPPYPPPLPLARPPPQYAGPKLVCTFKNDLKWPKIKKATNSKLYYIKFNISISTILRNKSSLTRAKAGYANYNFQNENFHNHPQVRTRPVFLWMVTHSTIKVYISAIRNLHVASVQHRHFTDQLTSRLEQVLRGIKKEQSYRLPTKIRLPITIQIMRQIKELLL